jgi:hypothetical protein
VRKLIEELRCARTWRRILAARKLGCRMHADCCAYPEVGEALIDALLCDRCGEVRQAAAESLRGQHAASDAGVLALYLASRLDPNRDVRTCAAQALDVLSRSRGPDCGPLYVSGDLLVRQLQAVHYRPGGADCRTQIVNVCSGAAVVPGVQDTAGIQDRSGYCPTSR